MDNEAVQRKIEVFFHQFRRVTYTKGELLLRQEETPRRIFYLVEGTVKMYTITEKGDDITLSIFKPHSFFPMFHVTDSEPSKYFFEAENLVTVYVAPIDEVLTFVQTNNDVLFDLLRRVYRGMDGLLTRMSYLMRGSAYERLILELLISAKRFGVKRQGVTELQISERTLAESSGMTRETVSREMKHLKDKGLVTYKTNMLIIHDLHQLESELH